ncbi:hypothetical protein [uncultured Acetobacteroides sp.]|uniref:hypothetical protein n=1 Tax=uncultured Acetobacteroides sp. TaxID=1760811 RepID=UPI0029F5B9DF|nr:hypothetical protein [uncultured Acetobacteroides sp.]
MKAKLVIGYILAGVGLLLIVWNGYLYVSEKSVEAISLTLGGVMYIAGAVLGKKNRRNE